MLVLNLACRDPLLRSEVIQDIHKVFKTVWSYKVPEEVNEILFCTDHESCQNSSENAKNSGNHKINKKHPAIEAFGKINSHTKLVQKSQNNVGDELLDLDEALKQLKLVWFHEIFYNFFCECFLEVLNKFHYCICTVWRIKKLCHSIFMWNQHQVVQNVGI